MFHAYLKCLHTVFSTASKATLALLPQFKLLCFFSASTRLDHKKNL